MGEPPASALLQGLVHRAFPVQCLVILPPYPCPSLPWSLWRPQLTACHLCRRDYIDPSHVKDGGVTPDDTRKWKVLQELQVSILLLLGAPCIHGLLPEHSLREAAPQSGSVQVRCQIVLKPSLSLP